MNARAFAIFFATATAWGQVATSPRLGEAETARTLGDRLAHATTDEQVKAWETMLRKSPDDPRLISGLVSAYLQKLRETADYRYLDRASQLVDRLLQRDGGNFEALRFENEIDLQRHDFRAVAERSRDMVRYNPSDPGIWGNLGDSLMELGEYESAREAYTKMFALRPNLGSYNRLAYLAFVTGKPDAAINLMKQAIEAGSAMPENTAWCSAELGDMYFKTGKLDEAEKSYRNALNLFPSLHRASAGMGQIRAAQGDFAGAIRDYERAQSVVPLVQYAGALEDLYVAAGKPEKARQQRDLLEAIETIGTATNEKTNRNLALVLADHGRNLPLALKLMQTEIPTRPDVYTWDAFSWVLFRSGRLAEAVDASAKALQLNTPEPLFYYHASAIANASGDRETALRYSARLMSLNSKFDAGKDARELLAQVGK
ncbi:MAG: tetratricopeptide repeat protein [Bryobacterales bacterium]|nr:tetratricopeptide repeat protein [Bryobacterales bacterium]